MLATSSKLEVNSVIVVLVDELKVLDGSLVNSPVEVEYKGLYS
jgi:hypothetical protein